MSGALPTVAVDADPSEAEAAAWTLQIHTCALHVLLLELLSVQVGRTINCGVVFKTVH